MAKVELANWKRRKILVIPQAIVVLTSDCNQTSANIALSPTKSNTIVARWRHHYINENQCHKMHNTDEITRYKSQRLSRLKSPAHALCDCIARIYIYTCIGCARNALLIAETSKENSIGKMARFNCACVYVILLNEFIEWLPAKSTKIYRSMIKLHRDPIEFSINGPLITFHLIENFVRDIQWHCQFFGNFATIAKAHQLLAELYTTGLRSDIVFS